MLVRLLARTGADVPPVEVAGPGYRPQVVAFTPAAGGWAVLAEDVRFPAVPAHTAVGVEVSDRRHTWLLPLGGPVDVAGGVEVVIPAGALRVGCEGSPAATGGAAGDGSTVPVGGWGDGLGNRASTSSQADTHG